MTRRIYWGLAILIVLLIGVSVVMLTRTTDTEPKVVYSDVEPSQEVVNQMRKPSKPTNFLAKKNDKVAVSESIGHFHPDGTFHKDTHANVPQPASVSEPVIYPHQALLDTHPVAALRAEARDRGHWSTEHIPPFPADDVLANELARAYYIYNYHKKAGPPYPSAFFESSRAITQLKIDAGLYKVSNDGPYGSKSVTSILFLTPYQSDLSRLIWSRIDTNLAKNFIPESTFTWEEYANANAQ